MQSHSMCLSTMPAIGASGQLCTLHGQRTKSRSGISTGVWTDTHCIDAHAGEGINDGSTAQQEHGSDQDVGHDAEDEEGDVGGLAPACICTAGRFHIISKQLSHMSRYSGSVPQAGLTEYCRIAVTGVALIRGVYTQGKRQRVVARELTDNLQNGVSSGCFALDLDGEDAKQQDLHSCTSSIPAWAYDNHACQTCSSHNELGQHTDLYCVHDCHIAVMQETCDCGPITGRLKRPVEEATERVDSPEWSRDAVLVGNIAGLQQCCSPCPCASQKVWSGTHGGCKMIKSAYVCIHSEACHDHQSNLGSGTHSG